MLESRKDQISSRWTISFHNLEVFENTEFERIELNKDDEQLLAKNDEFMLSEDEEQF